MTLVSCIITTRNRLKLLQRSVKSVLCQNYQNMELLIIDDGSDDGTREWCESLSNSDNCQISYIHIPKEESKGGNYARNLGIRASRGEYIAFLDDDDEWLPEKISKQVAVMEKNRDCVVVYGNKISEYVQENGEVINKQIPLNKKYQGDVSKKILTKIFTITSLIMIRKAALKSVGLFDENLKFWQEYELSVRLAQIGKFYFVDAPLIRYRVNIYDTNRLTNKYKEWKKAVAYVRSKHKKLYQRLSLFEKFSSHALIWSDASNRARICGKNILSKWYEGLYGAFVIVESIKEGTLKSKILKKLKKNTQV